MIFINQIRMKIGVMFGNPETTTGGNALKFYASVRIDIRRIGTIKDGDEVIGSRTKVKVVKNKVAPPFREAEFDILYGSGISKEGELVDMASEHNIIEKLGAWYSYGGERIGQGRENARDLLRANPKIADEVEGKLRAKLSAKVVAATDAVSNGASEPEESRHHPSSAATDSVFPVSSSGMRQTSRMPARTCSAAGLVFCVWTLVWLTGQEVRWRFHPTRLPAILREPAAIQCSMTSRCQIAAYSAQRKFRLERSLSPRNESRDARVYHRIEPDSRADPFTNLLDGVIGKSRDIKIFRDVAGACSCGERSRDALYGPGQ